MDASLTKGADPVVPLLPTWLAFLCAGACSSVAGYLVFVVEDEAHVARAMGVELPWISGAVLDAGPALPVALVLVSAAILALPGVRGSSARFRELRPVASALSVGAVLVAGMSLWSFVLVFVSLQKMLQR